jgi:N-hydroxyarylamine O-acetyltransferase
LRNAMRTSRAGCIDAIVHASMCSYNRAMDVARYLERIHYTDPVKPDVETLYRLQLVHMKAVPFENLDIGLKRPIKIDKESIWEKLIIQKRGGFCYELNGLFAWLLQRIGFVVTYLNARDYHETDDSFGIDFDHLALLVGIPDKSTRWLVDVGWGDTFTQPLDIDNTDWQEQGLRAYKIEPFRGGYQLWQRGYNGKIESQYYFDPSAHQFPAEYETTCRYHQTSPQSIFTRNRIVSRLTDNGRISLDNNRVILTVNGQRSERPLQDEAEFHALLLEHFDITLPKENS